MRPILALTLVLAACGTFPEIDAAVPASATRGDHPRLVPIEALLYGPETTLTEDTGPAVLGRVARLRARAARLRGPVVDAPTRSRMRSGVRPPA